MSSNCEKMYTFCLYLIIVFCLLIQLNCINCATLRTEGLEAFTTSKPTVSVLHAPVTAQINATLELVHVLFRYGPRTPVNTYPNDPYINGSFEPYGWGHLTNTAKVELYKIGKWLHKRYAHILGPYYKYTELQAQASASPRTIMSMQMVLAGMFPPENTAMEWNALLNWQPIPIVTEPNKDDILLRQAVYCPRYEQALHEVLELPEVRAQHEAYADMLKELSKLTGMNMTHAHDVTSLYMTLLAEQAYGLKLPDWTKNYFPEKMYQLAAQSYLYNVHTTEML